MGCQEAFIHFLQKFFGSFRTCVLEKKIEASKGPTSLLLACLAARSSPTYWAPLWKFKGFRNFEYIRARRYCKFMFAIPLLHTKLRAVILKEQFKTGISIFGPETQQKLKGIMTGKPGSTSPETGQKVESFSKREAIGALREEQLDLMQAL